MDGRWYPSSLRTMYQYYHSLKVFCISASSRFITVNWNQFWEENKDSIFPCNHGSDAKSSFNSFRPKISGSHVGCCETCSPENNEQCSCASNTLWFLCLVKKTRTFCLKQNSTANPPWTSAKTVPINVQNSSNRVKWIDRDIRYTDLDIQITEGIGFVKRTYFYLQDLLLLLLQSAVAVILLSVKDCSSLQ